MTANTISRRTNGDYHMLTRLTQTFYYGDFEPDGHTTERAAKN